jgi:hypothetical protein
MCIIAGSATIVIVAIVHSSFFHSDEIAYSTRPRAHRHTNTHVYQSNQASPDALGTTKKDTTVGGYSNFPPLLHRKRAESIARDIAACALVQPLYTFCLEQGETRQKV